MRCDVEAFDFLPKGGLRKQFQVIKSLADGTDLPVPKPYWIEEDIAILGGPFFVMERIDGEVQRDNPNRPSGLFFEASAEQRASMWKQAVEVMARLHRVDYRKLGLTDLEKDSDGENAIDRRIAYLERLMARMSERVLVLDTALDWLKANRYEPGFLCLCWGDARPGNIMYRDHEVVAILDWELAHIGCPESDLAYFLMIEGRDAGGRNGLSTLEGVPGREETIEYYESVAGRKLENLMFHEVAGALNLGIMLALSVDAWPDKGHKPFPPGFTQNNGATRALVNLLGASS